MSPISLTDASSSTRPAGADAADTSHRLKDVGEMYGMTDENFSKAFHTNRDIIFGSDEASIHQMLKVRSLPVLINIGDQMMEVAAIIAPRDALCAAYPGRGTPAKVIKQILALGPAITSAVENDKIATAQWMTKVHHAIETGNRRAVCPPHHHPHWAAGPDNLD